MSPAATTAATTKVVLRGGLLAAVLAAVIGHQVAGALGSRWLVLCAAAFGVLPVVSFLLRPRSAQLEVGRWMPVRTAVGAIVQTRLVVTNRGRRWSGPAVVVDSVAGLGEAVVAVPALAPGASVSLPVERTAVARGAWDGGVLAVTAFGPFGLVDERRWIPLGGTLHVHPPAVPPLSPLGAGDADGARPTGRAGRGLDPLQLREWRSGDGARSVHARASARHGRLLVLDREDLRTPRLVLLLAGAGSGEEWEAALARACSAAVLAVREGSAPVLLAAGHPAPEPLTVPAVLDWFAAADRAGALDDAVIDTALRVAAAGLGLTALVPADAEADLVRLRSAASRTRGRLEVLGG